MLLIAFFYFQNEKRLYFDLIKSNMQNIVSQISSKIIYAHMTNTNFDTTDILDTKDYKISFYNENKKKIFGNLNDEIDFSKEIVVHKEHFILVDDSTLGHLGVYYIAIEENLFHKKVKKLKLDIALFFLLVYSFVFLTGYYLAKLFLKPIKEERLKLNNFIKDTTHELNTPISAIMMSTESTSLNEKKIERIRLSAQRVSEIYKDLTYIFLQDKDKNRNVQNYNLKELIEEQLEYFIPLANKKRVEIKTQLEDFNFQIDKDDFIRVANNLISNALKYNKINGTIYISLKDGILTVEDTGIGIKKEKVNDIFNRYYRATNEQGGFGLGLNIVSDICKYYNIRVEVSSQYQKSTTFKLKF